MMQTKPKQHVRKYLLELININQVRLDSLDATFYSVPPPGSGAILAYILNMLDLYRISPKDDTPLLYHRIMETFK